MKELSKMTLWLLLVTLAFALACYGEVEVVGDKCVLVDGKPFFAIGIYNAWDPGGQHLPPDLGGPS